MRYWVDGRVGAPGPVSGCCGLYEHGEQCCSLLSVHLGIFKGGRTYAVAWPEKLETPGRCIIGHQAETDVAYCFKDRSEVCCDFSRREKVVAVLSICKVIVGQVGAAMPVRY